MNPIQHSLPPLRSREAGFALLVAVIFVSVMLSFALLIGTLAYKQSVLSNVTLQSQYAFYAADAALECMLEADRGENAFAYTAAPVAPTVFCNGSANRSSSATGLSGVAQFTHKFDIVAGGANRCAEVTVYKYQTRQGIYTTYLFSSGFSAACTNLTGTYASRFLRFRY